MGGDVVGVTVATDVTAVTLVVSVAMAMTVLVSSGLVC